MSSQRKTRAFEKRMSEVLGIRPNQVESVFRGARPTSIRVNRLLDEERYRETLEFVRAEAPGLIPVDWCEHSFFWPDNDGFDEVLPLAHEGRVYLQNAASLIPPVALDAQPGDSVLDVAAAPGGKAFHIAARTGNEGELWLNDSAPPRAAKLAELAELYGVRYAELTTHNAQYIDKSVPAERFDRILLDVQCSGEGRVNLRKSDALRFWSEERIEKYKHLQTKMCDAAYKLLKPGGTLVYSTCTLSPEEDEFPVHKVLRRHSDLSVAPLGFSEEEFLPGLGSWRGEKFDQGLRHAVRVRPSDVFEGFFVAKLVKDPS
ncbi:RsmB/NOP family class I SAM-dependent RNA methyltransferase [Saccharopolyspora sp. NPDC047091]|uniref:RsmB/NOP family class I SAM-dependent RNA methyltransferase n=1 Tax=Saccharopolyspora sp. NPDC047091 TaxID=3155924 RepID=UPI0033F85942